VIEQERNTKALRVIALSFVWIAFSMVFIACSVWGEKGLAILVAPVFLVSVVAVLLLQS
jgi:hypothetical protein